MWRNLKYRGIKRMRYNFSIILLLLGFLKIVLLIKKRRTLKYLIKHIIIIMLFIAGALYLATDPSDVGKIMGVCGFILQISPIFHTGEKNVRINKNKISFYEECCRNNINDCISEKEKQKAALIAQKHYIKVEDIVASFYEAKKLFEEEAANKMMMAQAAELDAQKESERIQCAQLERYSNLNGRDKRIAMLSAERDEALKMAQQLSSSAAGALTTFQEKEHDSAILGGIAAGITNSTAYGAATSMNYEAKNASIRARNETMRATLAPVMSSFYNMASEDRKRAEEINIEIEETKTKLVGEDSPAECLQHLLISETTVKVSETGTCTVKAKVRLNSSYVIYDEVDTVIDGTIIAKIYDGSTLIGVALLVLPKYGVKRIEMLTGMCLYCGTPGKKYTVQYAATKLWAMER